MTLRLLSFQTVYKLDIWLASFHLARLGIQQNRRKKSTIVQDTSRLSSSPVSTKRLRAVKMSFVHQGNGKLIVGNRDH